MPCRQSRLRLLGHPTVDGRHCGDGYKAEHVITLLFSNQKLGVPPTRSKPLTEHGVCGP
jgi:hypothetical protein